MAAADWEPQMLLLVDDSGGFAASAPLPSVARVLRDAKAVSKAPSPRPPPPPRP